MVLKNNLSILINIFLFVIIVVSIGSTNNCEPPAPPNNVCLEVDQDLCETADFSTAVISMKRTAKVDETTDQFGAPYVPGVGKEIRYKKNQDLICEDNLIVSATDKTLTSWQNRYIEGYEINFGFWSEDSYRRYSFAELFKWKYQRDPTPLEEQNITEQQAWQWFTERHTVKRPWPFADDPPRDVRFITPPIKQFCFNLNQNPPGIDLSYQTFTGEYIIEGMIEFGNGIKCRLEPLTIKRVNYDQGNSPHRVKIKIRPNCEACN